MIRVADAQDAAQIRDIYAPHVLTSTASFEVEVPSLATMEQRITDTLTTHPWLVYASAEGVRGYVYATSHRTRMAYQWSTDVSVYVHGEEQRRGLGRALYTALFAVLRLQGFYNAYAGITLPNPGSVRLHEAMGFVPVGVYHNVGYKFGSVARCWLVVAGPSTQGGAADTTCSLRRSTRTAAGRRSIWTRRHVWCVYSESGMGGSAAIPGLDEAHGTPGPPARTSNLYRAESSCGSRRLLRLRFRSGIPPARTFILPRRDGTPCDVLHARRVERREGMGGAKRLVLLVGVAQSKQRYIGIERHGVVQTSLRRSNAGAWRLRRRNRPTIFCPRGRCCNG